VVHGILVGADCIDDLDLLRSGATERVLGHKAMARSTIGTWLRSFTFGHVRQFDKLTETLLSRAWAAGAGPGDAPMSIDVNSTVCEVHGYAKQGAAYGYTQVLGYHPILATQADTGEVVHARMRTGSANTARRAQRFVRETIGRACRAGPSGRLTLRADSGFWSNKVIDACTDHGVRYAITGRQAQLWPDWRHHAFVTDCDGDKVTLDAPRPLAYPAQTAHGLKSYEGLIVRSSTRARPAVASTTPAAETPEPFDDTSASSAVQHSRAGPDPAPSPASGGR
jgi:hypothetical protein